MMSEVDDEGKSYCSHFSKPNQTKPNSCNDLFVAFTIIALQGFGGVLAVAQRTLCDKKKWLSNNDFVELLALSSALPGPNVMNLAVILGDRYFGLRGAFSALLGMLMFPLLAILMITIFYESSQAEPMVSAAFGGMKIVAAGLIIGTAMKLLGSLRKNEMGFGMSLILGFSVFVLVAILRLPLVFVFVIAVFFGSLFSYWHIRFSKYKKLS